jgi:hypothetical protein
MVITWGFGSYAFKNHNQFCPHSFGTSNLKVGHMREFMCSQDDGNLVNMLSVKNVRLRMWSPKLKTF